MATYLARYLAGEHDQVWHELVKMGDAVREEPVFTDAEAVAREMMRRVRDNIERLIPRLREHGYRCALQEPLTPPVDQVESYLAVMEEWGPLPLALRAFYEVVGAVSLDGTFAQDQPWYESAAFPLAF